MAITIHRPSISVRGAAAVTRRVMSLCLLAAAVLPIGLVHADEAGLKDGARQAGRTTGSVMRDIGQGAKKIGQEIGHGAKEAGQAIGGAAKEGGREFRRAVRGDH